MQGGGDYLLGENDVVCLVVANAIIGLARVIRFSAVIAI